MNEIPAADAGCTAGEHADRGLPARGDDGWRPRVVVVEDEPITKRIAARELRKWGYETDVATSSEEAWPLLMGDERPLIAILDWGLPKENGPSLCRRLREAASARPVYVLFITARHGSDDAAMAIEAGADDLLVKPLDLGEFRQRVAIAEQMLYLER